MARGGKDDGKPPAHGKPGGPSIGQKPHPDGSGPQKGPKHGGGGSDTK
ncbi:hypothetical protein [Streptomyces ehimensis]|uniref:Uncharacterized protein n=1 Tax=Streptomyces ehimensis TaxID=68195 RepID=A0ABV9BDV0_9ACTN